MTTKTNIGVIRGKTNYCKLLGDPRLNYSGDGREWTVDILIDEDTIKELKKLGIDDKVRRKDNYLDNQPFLTFRQREFLPDGREADRPEVRDITNKLWDQEVNIGNGSVVDVKFVVKDYGKGKKKGMYLRSMRVMDHVPYDDGFKEPDENDEYYEAYLKATAAAASNVDEQADELNDDIPFATDEIDDEVM